MEGKINREDSTNNQSRHWIYLIATLLVVILGVAIGVLLITSQTDEGSNDNSQSSTTREEGLTPTEIEEFEFKRFPFDIEDIGSIAPIGEFAGINRNTVSTSHFYGNMRHYVFSKEPGKRAYNVYVPSDAEVVGFRHSEMTGQFRFNFYINDGAFYYIDHIQSLSEETMRKLEVSFGYPPRYTQAVEQVSPPIKVTAGEILGQTGLKGIAWDWGVIDQSACDGILFPEHYQQDRCPRSAYDFFNDEMKEQVIDLAGYWAAPPDGGGLDRVMTKPILGQYAHDVAETLSGGWFLEYKDPFPQNAFFVPDSYQPNMLQIRLGVPELSLLGVWNRIPIGEGKSNPDPRQVNVNDGIVSYTLGKKNGRDTSEYGVLLVRVNADDTITVETLADLEQPPANPLFSSKAITMKR